MTKKLKCITITIGDLTFDKHILHNTTHKHFTYSTQIECIKETCIFYNQNIENCVFAEFSDENGGTFVTSGIGSFQEFFLSIFII